MEDNQLYAGAGNVPICFPESLFPTEGFCGIHDDPGARTLLLQCRKRVAIVCLELVSLPPDLIDAVKTKVSKIVNAEHENVWVHTTHTISTPHAPYALVGMGGVELEHNEAEKASLERKTLLYRTALMDAVEQSAREALFSFRAARMGVGVGECSVNMSRDVETPHGWWVGFAPEQISNHTATVLRFESLRGDPIAFFISYGLKPCAIDNSEMEKNARLVSADIPGLACFLLERQFGAPCIFAMSAAGDQVPLEQAWYDVVETDGTIRKVDLGVQEGLNIVEKLGRRMAEEIAPIIEKIACNLTAPTIRTGAGHIVWPGKARMPQKLSRHAIYTPEGNQRVDALVITIGDVALVAVKPEINAVTEQKLHQMSPYTHTLVLSMVNGGQKYMPDLRSYENNTWEAQSSAMLPGAAEAWVTEATAVLERIFKGENGND